MLIYKVLHGEKGLKDLEHKVSAHLNQGWKPVGGLAFNQGHCYQAMVGKSAKPLSAAESEQVVSGAEIKPKPVGAAEAMRNVDELT